MHSGIVEIVLGTKNYSFKTLGNYLPLTRGETFTSTSEKDKRQNPPKLRFQLHGFLDQALCIFPDLPGVSKQQIRGSRRGKGKQSLSSTDQISITSCPLLLLALCPPLPGSLPDMLQGCVTFPLIRTPSLFISQFVTTLWTVEFISSGYSLLLNNMP